MTRKTGPSGRSQPHLFSHHGRGPSAERLLRSLARTLDLDETIRELSISREEAREVLEALVHDRFEGSTPGTVSGAGEGGACGAGRGKKGHGANASGGARGLTRRPSSAISGRAADQSGTFFSVYVDGGSRGNPGPSGAGAVILDPSGRTLKRLKKHLGRGTNNRAEYMALIMALESARALGAENVQVYADSELMVRQVTGRYRVRSRALAPLYERVMDLLSSFRSYRISHIPRSENSEADRLANEAMDGGKGR